MKNLINKVAVAVSSIAMVSSFAFVGTATVSAATAGGVYKTSDGTVWFVTKDMQKRAFTSWGAFLTYGFLNASQVTDADSSVTSLTSGAFVPPADGKIFCATETKGTDVKGECALITGGKKAAFTSASVFTGQGYSFSRAINGDSSFLEKTANIDNASAAHLPGTLVNNGGTVQMVVSGGLWGIPSVDVFNTWGYSFADVVPANSADTAKSQVGVIPARMAGELVPTGTTTPSEGGADCDDLEGTTGSITATALSDYSGEEVGEGESEVPIMAFEIEADNDSDVAITSVKVEFDEGGTGSEDLEDYASEVVVMLNGDVVGSADVDDFTETATNGTWTKTITLDCAAVAADSTEEFTIAIDGNDVIDSGDLNQNWAVDVISIRFEDGDGVVSTDDTDSDTLEKNFTWQSFANASDIEMNVALTDGADDINDAHVIDIDDVDDTDNAEILAFTIENKGDVDITVNDIPVVIATVEAAGTHFDDPAEVITKVTLWSDGDEISSDSLTETDANDSETALFEDLDIDIDAGDSMDFVVAVDLQDTGSVLDNGDTVSATVTVDDIDADDSAGDQISDANATGAAASGAHGVYDVGMKAVFVSSEAKATPSGVATVDDTGTFKIVFDVTAFDTDIFIDASPIVDETGIIAAGAAGYQNIDASTTSVASGVIECTGCDTAANTTLKVREGETERFTVTIAGSGADIFASASLTSIMYATTAVDGALLYTFNMGDFKTDSVWLDSN